MSMDAYMEYLATRIHEVTDTWDRPTELRALGNGPLGQVSTIFGIEMDAHPSELAQRFVKELGFKVGTGERTHHDIKAILVVAGNAPLARAVENTEHVVMGRRSSYAQKINAEREAAGLRPLRYADMPGAIESRMGIIVDEHENVGWLFYHRGIPDPVHTYRSDRDQGDAKLHGDIPDILKNVWQIIHHARSVKPRTMKQG